MLRKHPVQVALMAILATTLGTACNDEKSNSSPSVPEISNPNSGSEAGTYLGESVESDDGSYTAEISALNKDAGNLAGVARFNVAAGQLTADVAVTGAQEKAGYVQYIHAASECPKADSEVLKDGKITTEEANAAFGEVFFALDGDLSSVEGGSAQSPISDDKGAYTYSQSASVEAILADIRALHAPAAEAAIVTEQAAGQSAGQTGEKCEEPKGKEQPKGEKCEEPKGKEQPKGEKCEEPKGEEKPNGEKCEPNQSSKQEGKGDDEYARLNLEGRVVVIYGTEDDQAGMPLACGKIVKNPEQQAGQTDSKDEGKDDTKQPVGQKEEPKTPEMPKVEEPKGKEQPKGEQPKGEEPKGKEQPKGEQPKGEEKPKGEEPKGKEASPEQKGNEKPNQKI